MADCREERRSPNAGWGSGFGYSAATAPAGRVVEGAGMAGEADEAEGRIKEAAGDLTGNDDLKNEGKADKVGGKIKRRFG